ncbi:MAG: circularly permuted type 2 ATP-grasp protein [Lachnospiraceae bacterium]
MHELIKHTDTVNELLARYSVKFGIYKDNAFIEQLFPFDAIARVITKDEFQLLEKGLKQRIEALNLFLVDIYGEQKIIKDGIIPAEFVFSSSNFLAECMNIRPACDTYSHISGIDLVQAKDKSWVVLEDNLRIPSGASYPMIAREICRKASPDTFKQNHVYENRNYADLLKTTMDDVNQGGINVILTPGRYNAAFFEHSYLAEKSGAVLVNGQDLFVENDVLYYLDYMGKKLRVGSIYRRISDDYLDPMTFNAKSEIGVPHIMEAYRKGNVSIINAPGNGVADDKGIYYFVPKMIKYYLNEETILSNAPTYLPFYEEDMKYILSNFDNLVLKDVAEAGGYGVVFGSSMTKDQKSQFLDMLKANPRRFIAQEVIHFLDIDIVENGKLVPRKADLRAFVLAGKKIKIWKSGLTRFSRDPKSYIVNSSQGGGFKDTWVLSR